jgi:hypothetical protein
MAKLGFLAAALLCVCPTGHADSLDLSRLSFWPQPLSAPQLPLDTSNAEPNATESQNRDTERTQPLEAARHDELAAAVTTQLNGVEAERSRNGERSAALVDKLVTLASSYRKLGESEAAAAALAQAIEVARINFGLHSLDQASAVEALVENHETSGDFAAAAEKRRYLRDLVERNSDDPRVFGILTEIAAQEMDDARRLVGVPAPSENAISLGGAAPSSGPPKFGTQAQDRLESRLSGGPPPTPSLEALWTAQSDYAAALQAAVTHSSNVSVADVFAAEDALADTAYFALAHPEIVGLGNARSPSAIKRASDIATMNFWAAQGLILQHKAVHSTRFRRPAVDVAKDWIALADWYLVFAGSSRLAFDTYRMARDLLVKSNVSRETINQLLSPELPPAVPVLPESIIGTIHNQALHGYIDAVIEITRFGEVKRVEILGRSETVTKVIEEQLTRHVAGQTFRPRFASGDPPRSDRFSARFYF